MVQTLDRYFDREGNELMISAVKKDWSNVASVMRTKTMTVKQYEEMFTPTETDLSKLAEETVISLNSLKPLWAPLSKRYYLAYNAVSIILEALRKVKKEGF